MRLDPRPGCPQGAGVIVRLSASEIDTEPHNCLLERAGEEWRGHAFGSYAVSRGPVADSNQRGLVDAGG